MTARLYHAAAVTVQAARRLEGLRGGHIHGGHIHGGRLHGHGFLIRARAALPPDDAGDETRTLQARLAATTAPLDYSLLNDHLERPDDTALARWLGQRLDLPGPVQVGVRSTRDQGVELDFDGRARLWRRFRFEAAHQLPNVPPGHQCGRMHGHGFEVILHVHGDAGLGYADLEARWAPFHAELDHACLNDLPGLDNPTSERLAAWLWARLKPDLPALCRVTVFETVTAGCHYNGQDYRIWKEQRFEAALRLARAPAGDPRRRLHGHSYLIRLHLGAPLDRVLGWTVDYGDVKALFRPVYEALDHHRLDGLPGLASPEPADLLAWIRDRMAGRLPQLDRIDLYQTPGCGALLCWNGAGP